MKKIKYKILESEEQKELFNKICDDIIQITNEYRDRRNAPSKFKGELLGFSGDLTDIGNWIGIAIGMNTCKDEKDLNIRAFSQGDFISGFEHGYSIHDGTH
jgi:hypothetical protein